MRMLDHHSPRAVLARHRGGTLYGTLGQPQAGQALPVPQLGDRSLVLDHRLARSAHAAVGQRFQVPRQQRHAVRAVAEQVALHQQPRGAIRDVITHAGGAVQRGAKGNEIAGAVAPTARQAVHCRHAHLLPPLHSC